MKVKEYLLLFVILLMTLSSLAIINVPVTVVAQPEPYVKVYVNQTLGYIPGVAPGGKVTIDIIIEASNIIDDSTEGIVGWGMHVQVNPDVLNLTNARARGSTAGYFLWEFADYYWYDYPTLLGGSANATSGYWRDISEMIMPFPAGGAGEGYSGLKLVTLEFNSNNETAYSRIDLIGVAIFTHDREWYSANETIDGHYNQFIPHNLTVGSTPIDGIDFTIDSTTYTTNTTVELQEGKSYTVTMNSTGMNGTDQYNFLKWEDDSTNRVRDVSLTSDKTITATYELATQNYTLTVNSVPISGVNFTIGSTPYATNKSVSLLEGTYTVTMPSTWMNVTDKYLFRHWEDDSTDRVRDVSLTSDKTITATYELQQNYTLTVDSVPISGVNFTIEYRIDLMPYTATYMTNKSISLLEGITYTITISSAWTVDTDLYLFTKWEDNSTDSTRTTPLTSDKTITATYQIPYVKVYVDQPLGYIPGQPPNETVTIDIIIEVSNITDNSGAGIVGWGFDLQVDPNVIDISINNVTGGMAGYLLYNFSDYYGYSYPTFILGATNVTTGYWNDISEQIVPTPSGGAGDSWSGLKLVTISFTSKNETAYSKIDLLDAFCWTAGGAQYPVDEIIDGHYNQPYILTVQSTPIDGIDFTVDTTTYTTNQSIGFPEGNYTVTMPSTWMNVTDQYNFLKWEDDSTNPVRTISLTANTTITATYGRVPEASFTFSPTEPIVDKTVTFNASASNDPDGTIVSYAWDFGDGTTEIYVKDVNLTAIATHAYETAGNYTTTLTVTDDDGLSHTFTSIITVKEAPPSTQWQLYVVAAAVAAIIIIAIAVYYLKFIRQKPT